jgi:epoxyqueuosine reductase
VCPWNSFAEPTSEEAFLTREGLDGPSLIEWMTMTQEEFSARMATKGGRAVLNARRRKGRHSFKGSPIKRAKRRGLLRNVVVALGNWGAPEAVPGAGRRAFRRRAAGARPCRVGAGANPG